MFFSSDSDGKVQKQHYNEAGNPQYKYYYPSVEESKKITIFCLSYAHDLNTSLYLSIKIFFEREKGGITCFGAVYYSSKQTDRPGMGKVIEVLLLLNIFRNNLISVVTSMKKVANSQEKEEL